MRYIGQSDLAIAARSQGAVLLGPVRHNPTRFAPHEPAKPQKKNRVSKRDTEGVSFKKSKHTNVINEIWRRTVGPGSQQGEIRFCQPKIVIGVDTLPEMSSLCGKRAALIRSLSTAQIFRKFAPATITCCASIPMGGIVFAQLRRGGSVARLPHRGAAGLAQARPVALQADRNCADVGDFART
jgi:hypothetical protein